MPKHKPQDAAFGVIAIGLTIGVAMALGGMGICSIIPVVGCLLVGNSMFGPVWEGVRESKTVEWIYSEIYSLGVPSSNRDEWLKSLSYENMIYIRDICRGNSQTHIYRWLMMEWMDAKKYKTIEDVEDAEIMNSNISYNVEFHKTKEQEMKERKLQELIESSQEKVTLNVSPSPRGEG